MSDLSNEYNEDTQRLLISYMLGDPTSFTQSQSIIKPEYFDDKLRPAVRYMMEFSAEYRALPVPAQIKAKTGLDVDRFEEPSPQFADWYITEVEKFCRYKALELAVLDGVDLLQKGAGGELERRVRDAMTITLNRDLGTDYFADPKARLINMRERNDYISTGWKSIDHKLYGGFTRGALNVFAGGSGSGKSLFLQNIALNWVFMGLNVVYFTLELSEDLVSMRLDAMVSGVGTRDIFKNLDEVHRRIRGKAQNAGNLKVKKMPEAGTTANDLRAFLKEYEIQTGIKPDAIVVDYLDLMHPCNLKVNPSDMFVKDKYTSEEMRALAGEANVLCCTASQLNRASVEAQEFDHSHIAGGISKINTADNVFGIFTSMTMRERGEYQIQFLKTRSSSAVGQKVSLKFDPTSMLISDADPEDITRPSDPKTVAESLKAKTATSRPAEDAPAPDHATEKAEAARTDMKSLMNRIQKRTEL